MSNRSGFDDPRVRAVQWTIGGAMAVFMLGIVAWVLHLIRTAWNLRDVPSASIGISVVAIPVFLTLLTVLVYVFLGLMLDRSER